MIEVPYITNTQLETGFLQKESVQNKLPNCVIYIQILIMRTKNVHFQAKMEIVTVQKNIESIVQTIRKNRHTGCKGDGIIPLTPTKQATRIRYSA
ncbi:P-II family nitrogen regulator [Fodinibius sp. AD559]|uniref:P-II family nitrogen regulator n=1 Tax=Fodinibius sp. AD559 TaxID=3424179 RepID=UPI004046B533